MLTEARWAADLIRDWGWIEKRGIMAKPGGLHDQCPRWLEAIELIDNEIEKHRDREREAANNGTGNRHRDPSNRQGFGQR